jgi:pSer/pThr/pTyr-binding forkhead associated (FHA) protein
VADRGRREPRSTFVNRKRVESAALEDSDEIQIGKYRLTFLTR